MTIAYTRVIRNLPAYVEIDGNSDVVFAIDWVMVGAEGVFSSNTPLNTQVPYVAGQPFVPYANLTEVEVNAWIDEYTDASQIEAAQQEISQSIARQQAVATLPLPWAPPPPV